MKTYNEKVHFLGRLTTAVGVVAMLLVPTVMCFVLKVWPEPVALLSGLVAVWALFIPVNFIEFFTYTPMLGSSGSYLAFLTGNVSNLKLPCALNTMEIVGVERGSEEGDIVSSLAIASSSIVTILLIIVGLVVIMLGSNFLAAPVLAPAFDNVLPALFGALALVLIGKNIKIAIAPLTFAILVYGIAMILNLSGILNESQTKLLNTVTNPSLLVPVAAAISIFVARKLYKKNKINLNNYK